MSTHSNTSADFQPEAFKAAARAQWDKAAPGWNEHTPQIRAWLRQATDAMLDMADITVGSHVLDVAAGAGDQTLDVARRIGPSGRVLATDFSASILEFAKTNALHSGYDNVETRVADGEALPVEAASFDAVVCRLGLMFFPDPLRGLQEMHHALKPGGGACTIVFSSPAANPCIGIMLSTAFKHAGLPPRDPYAPGGLLSLGKPGLVDELFRSADFKSVATTKLDAPFRGRLMQNVQSSLHRTARSGRRVCCSRSFLRHVPVISAATFLCIEPIGSAADVPNAPSSFPELHMRARVIAAGLGSVEGVRQVGRFHAGGPLATNPEFLLQTQARHVLAPERLLVAVASNFGATPGSSAYASGAVLSIDPLAAQFAPLIVPPLFAVGGGQRAALNGAVRLYTAQSADFRNSRHNGASRTSAQAAASGPRYLSINNAFGRPWIANAPQGLAGDGSESVVDPDGTPLANAPSAAAGGVFVGGTTAREQAPSAVRTGLWAQMVNYRSSRQLTAGALSHGALGTAFLGASPDGSGLAVFAVATGDGAIAQVHVQDGVDGLAPAGTISVGSADPGVIGMAFKWNPDRVLYVCDAARDRLVVMHLGNDRQHFTLRNITHIPSTAFNHPVDVAATMPEIANAAFASHTTLSGASDLYVANRGDGSLLRISPDGKVLARARIDLAGLGLVGAERIRAMAVSADAQKIWLTIVGELPGLQGHAGALIEVSAFDANGPFESPALQPHVVPASSIMAQRNVSRSEDGEKLFRTAFTLQTGLGAHFNADSCVSCHPGPGGMSTNEEHFVRRIAHMDTVSGRSASIADDGSPVARRFAMFATGATDMTPPLPRAANVSSLRMPLALYDIGRLDEIDDAAIEAQAVSKGDGIKGRVHYVKPADGVQGVGRYGWKADSATLEHTVASAFSNEMGMNDSPHTQGQPPVKNEGGIVHAVASYLRTLRSPATAP